MAVLVYTQNWDGKFKKSSYELVSYANALAELLKTNVIGLSLGPVSEDELNELGKYGAGKIITVPDVLFKTLDNQAFSKVISLIAGNVGADVVLFSHDNTGKALAPRVSVKLKAGLVSGVTDLPLSVDPFTLRKKVFSGNCYAKQIVNTDKKVLTLAKNSFEIKGNPVSVEIEVFQTDIQSEEFKTHVKDVQKQTGKVILTDAEIVVSAGRGMKSPDNWGPIEELAELLGAATACSRPVSDEGWRPHQEHTGQTGKIIAPNLYIAVGISGAIQHLAGVSSSKVIVAVNTDKDAPIFEAADYGIVGDAMKVLPELIQAVKEMKAS